MNVLHFSISPVAGSPIQIVKALNKYTNISARSIVLKPNLYGPRTFENDISFLEQKDYVLTLLENADIIHLHQYLDLKNNEFGIDFNTYIKKGVKVLRQYHSSPYALQQYTGFSPNEIIFSEIPSIVIGQFHERYYPKSAIVPQIIPIKESLYIPIKKEFDQLVISYFPSAKNTAWFNLDYNYHWDTKGYPETVELINNIKEQFKNVDTIIKTDLKHEHCLRLKQKSHISIDEIVTGSYHRSSLESLSQGIATFCYLDNRVEFVLKELSGTDTIPLLNFDITTAENKIKELIQNPEMIKEISNNSRQWIENYFSDEKMINYYTKIYIDLLENPDKLKIERIKQNESMFILEKNALSWHHIFENYKIKKLKAIIEKNKGKTIYFYGFGKYAQQIFNFIDLSQLNIAGFFDKQPSVEKFQNLPVYKFDEIVRLKPDIIITTLQNPNCVISDLVKLKQKHNIAFEIINDLF